MKLILTAAVENLGVPGDIVEVKPGYGRNYLLPRGYAIVATRGAEKQIEGIKRAQLHREIRDADHAREVRSALEALTNVTVAVKAAESGKLFGSVKADDVVAAVKAAGGPSLDKHKVSLGKGHIKKAGNYQAIVQLHSNVSAKVNFKVVAA